SSFSDGFIDHGAYADTPDVLHAIGAQVALPRAQDAATMSVIDARNYSDGSSQPAPSNSPPSAPVAGAASAGLDAATLPDAPPSPAAPN
ncbi:MAG: hypothetical protein JO234_00835, partial [Hyphomicrobiales bacterium]|nr:hypothetical protein [Hyphomicrobiales bacterium]